MEKSLGSTKCWDKPGGFWRQRVTCPIICPVLRAARELPPFTTRVAVFKEAPSAKLGSLSSRLSSHPQPLAYIKGSIITK